MCKEYENCTSCPQCGSRHTGLAGFDDSNTLLAHRVCKRCGMRWDSAFSGFSTGIMDDLEAFATFPTKNSGCFTRYPAKQTSGFFHARTAVSFEFCPSNGSPFCKGMENLFLAHAPRTFNCPQHQTLHVHTEY